MTLHLYLSVPVAGFRVAHAREYWETYRCPPPSTVYGMLLSLVGEPDRLMHRGAELAIALVDEVVPSRVLRSLWRVKALAVEPGLGQNKRPDFQEVLTGMRLSVWLRPGVREPARPTLAERVAAGLKDPRGIVRFGGLSLGESTQLVDEVRPWRPQDPRRGWSLLTDAAGDLSLPVWPDHVGSAGSRFAQYRLCSGPLDAEPDPEAWSAILPPGTAA